MKQIIRLDNGEDWEKQENGKWAILSDYEPELNPPPFTEEEFQEYKERIELDSFLDRCRTEETIW